MRLGVKPAQDAIEANDEIDAAERRVELLNMLVGGAEHVARARDGENEAFVDGAKERQAAVRIHVADGAAVVVAANLHDERIGRKAERAEVVGQAGRWRRRTRVRRARR